MQQGRDQETGTRWHRVAGLAGLFLAELVLLAVIYQFLAQIDCRDTGFRWGCTFLRSMVGRAIVVFAALGLVIWAWPKAMRDFLAEARQAAGRWPPLVHAAGLVLMLMPVLLGWGPDLGAHFGRAVPFWVAGALAATVGGLAWVAPRAAWGRLLRYQRGAIAGVLALAAILPDLAEAIRPLWDWTLLSGLTFDAVAWALSQVSAEVYADPALYRIGVNSTSGGFIVAVGQPCSGVEGFALVTAFVAIYGYLFRSDLRFPLYWLVVLPFGLLASWLLNVLRIAVLVLIGAHVSPELAVNGFHSYAGWLLFTLLTMALMALVQVTPWLHQSGRRAAPARPLREDWVAAQILPFVALMLGGIVTSAFLVQPALGYPLVAVLVMAALWPFRGLLSRLEVRADPLVLAVGGGIGLIWVLLAPAPAAQSPDLAALGPVAFTLWVVFRFVGTGFLVPLVEELFFRGYLLQRLDGPDLWRRGFALAATSLAFGLLHERWIIASLCGLAFGLLALRRGRLGDAVLAHVVANTLIAVVALIQGDWNLI